VAGRFEVVPCCRALSARGIAISPRTYHARRRPPSARARRDAWLTGILRAVFEPDARGRRKPASLYGAVKIWGWLGRQDITVARCTIERLMKANGWRGLRRVVTTVPNPAHPRRPDLVNRDFSPTGPGRLLVADFTYVPLLAGGFAYTAFVIDAFAGTICGWECLASRSTAFVLRAIAQAGSHLRASSGGLLAGTIIHHSDAGSQPRLNRP
jgi:putative transposase